MPDKRITREQTRAGVRAMVDEIHYVIQENHGVMDGESVKLPDLSPAREGVPECALEIAARAGAVEITERADGLTVSAVDGFQPYTSRIDGSDGLSYQQAREQREEQKAKELGRRILRRLAVEPDHILELSKIAECIQHPTFKRALIALHEAGVIGMVKANGNYLIRLAVNPDLSPEPEIPEELPEEHTAEAPDVGPAPDLWADDLYRQSADTHYDGTNPDGLLVSPEIIADRVDQDGEFHGSPVGEEEIDILD